MKKTLFTILACSLFLNTVPASAQSMPNRTTEAQVVVDAHPDLWTGTDNKRQLTTMICTVLNRLDGGLWGLLQKDDRNPPYVPEDILVWRPNRVHVDVLHDSGTVPWIVHTETPAIWTWISCGGQTTPDPVPNPGTIVPNPGTDLQAQILAALQAHETEEAKDRAASRAFEQSVGTEYAKFGKFVAKYGSIIAGALLGGKYIWGSE